MESSVVARNRPGGEVEASADRPRWNGKIAARTVDLIWPNVWHRPLMRIWRRSALRRPSADFHPARRVHLHRTGLCMQIYWYCIEMLRVIAVLLLDFHGCLNWNHFYLRWKLSGNARMVHTLTKLMGVYFQCCWREKKLRLEFNITVITSEKFRALNAAVDFIIIVKVDENKPEARKRPTLTRPIRINLQSLWLEKIGPQSLI